MIEINLVPEQLRKKRRAAAMVESLGGLPKELILGIVVAFTLVLILVFLGFQAYAGLRIAKRNDFNRQLAAIDAEKKNVEKVLAEMKTLKERAKTLETVVAPYNIFWAEKINVVSNEVPRGVWLTKLALEDKYLIIEGSAVSKTKSEITDIHSFMARLKANKDFMTKLKNLDLDMIKARNVDTLTVADFKIKAEILNETVKNGKK